MILFLRGYSASFTDLLHGDTMGSISPFLASHHASIFVIGLNSWGSVYLPGSRTRS